MNGITWLASYPKSGNTWLRVFLTNLRRDGDAPADINDLERGLLASGRVSFESAVPCEAVDLTHEEVDRLRPLVYLDYAQRANEPYLFCKVHDACSILPTGQPLFPPHATAGVIYLIRNPLDVCVSFAHHMDCRDYNQVISWMANPDYMLAGERDRTQEQLRQCLSTWSGHVLSWVDGPLERRLILRYEDMQAVPLESFAAAAAFVGLPHDPERIGRAIRFSSFDELQRQEQKRGFSDGVRAGKSFFRKGKVGSWREELTTPQIARLIEDHHDVMVRFGYLTATGELTY